MKVMITLGKLKTMMEACFDQGKISCEDMEKDFLQKILSQENVAKRFFKKVYQVSELMGHEDGTRFVHVTLGNCVLRKSNGKFTMLFEDGKQIPITIQCYPWNCYMVKELV